MTIKTIGDSQEDHVAWLKARSIRVTSSDFFTVRGADIPNWWSDTAESTFAAKLSGEGKEFPREAWISMQHGIADEAGIQRKLGTEVGSRVENCNQLFVNSRWPLLAASIDGFIFPPHALGTNLYAQDPEPMARLREYLIKAGERGDKPALCEAKKSTSSKWQTEVPRYYMDQLQGQMHILDIPHAIIVAECISYQKPKGENRKRPFWDLRAYLVKRRESYVRDLEIIQDKWRTALTEAGRDDILRELEDK